MLIPKNINQEIREDKLILCVWISRNKFRKNNFLIDFETLQQLHNER